MRKEISGILLFFLVVLTFFSLATYSSLDPSVNNAASPKEINNLFGLFGAHFSGLLISLFGVGSFWIPVIFLISGIQVVLKKPSKELAQTVGGGVLLVITTGAFAALFGNTVVLFSIKFSSGGMLGIPIGWAAVKYTNFSGGVFIIAVIWAIAFIIMTRFSITASFKRLIAITAAFINRIKELAHKLYERRKKAKKLNIALKEQEKKAKPKIKIAAPLEKKPAKKPQKKQKQEVFEFMKSDMDYELPGINLLDDPPETFSPVDAETLAAQSKLLEKKLEDFGVTGSITEVAPGPVITTFEYAPAPGVKINKIVNLTDDLALALRAISIRIVAPIPGKAAVGIEIPNHDRQTVHIKDIIDSDVFSKSKSKLTLCLGKDIVGNPVVAPMDKMPHMLIAGATGTGKSVGLNTMISSILFNATPEDVRFIMVDPKRIELSNYDGIPHLITPVVTDAKKATNALFWAVKEMERRYVLLAEVKAKNILQYNQKIKAMEKENEKESAADKKSGSDNSADVTGDDAANDESNGAADAAVSDETANGEEETIKHEKLPYIIIIIDELADLMMVASRDVEVALARLAQMARAAGIHLILATQRPSVDVLTGMIKANFPTRLSFQVSSRTDSRTIIDSNGAENLLGNGDLLFLPPGTAKLQRIHGAFISEDELARVIDFLKQQKPPDYLMSVTEPVKEEKKDGEREDMDEKYDDAVALVCKSGQASISMVQRHLRIGYNRAARIIEVMEEEGIIGPSDGVKPREVLAKAYDDIP